MKKILFSFLLFFLFNNEVNAQFSGESVEVFGIKLKAKEVTGQKRFDASDFLYKTKILKPLQARKKDEILYSIGSYRRDKNIFEAIDLFNMSFEKEPHPFLDLIDFDYYRNVGVALVERDNPELKNNHDFIKLKGYLVDSVNLSIKERKNILFSFPLELRNKIISSRYEIIKNTFSVDKKKVSETTADLKASLDTIKINASSEIKAEFRKYLSRLADEVTFINGIYYDIRLHPSYISKIDYYMSQAIAVELENDQFVANLKKYKESSEAAINSGLVAIQLEGKFNKTKINIDSIQGGLASKFELPVDELKKIAVSINFAFTKKENITFLNEFNNAFVIRYFTSKTMNDVQFKRLKFNYADGNRFGVNMANLVTTLENYYITNNEFPKSLKSLNADQLIFSLGEGKLDYRALSPNDVSLRFAGEDYELYTSDDKIYVGKNGKFNRIK